MTFWTFFILTSSLVHLRDIWKSYLKSPIVDQFVSLQALFFFWNMKDLSGPCVFDVEMNSLNYRKAFSRPFTTGTSSWELKEIIWFLFLKRIASGNVNTVFLAFLRCIALLPSSLNTSFLSCINLYKLLCCSYVFNNGHF